MSTPPSELRARIGAQVRASRQAQGLSPYVSDPATLDRLAGRVELAAELPGLPGVRTDEPATVWHQGDEVGGRYAS